MPSNYRTSSPYVQQGTPSPASRGSASVRTPSPASQTPIADPLSGGDEDDNVLPQALDILAGLTSLGIAPSLRDKVQQALAELSATSSGAAVAAAAHAPGGGGAPGTAASTSGRAGENALQKRVAELEQKMATSRSIMKKLYHKNVALEKELALIQANQQGVVVAGVGSAATATPPGTAGADRPSTAAGSAPLAQMMQERDLTIQQLQQALDAARRRCAMLEAQLAGGSPGTPGGRGARGSGVSQGALQDVMAQSALHLHKYKQIREDYNRLLVKRVAALQTSSKASSAARSLVGDLQSRLVAEVQEREAEAALYSARLYESERAMSDWYVEKRLLEDHIAKLSSEVQERDRLDGEIEGCVASLFERLQQVEERNEALRARLAALGVADVDVGSGVSEVLAVP